MSKYSTEEIKDKIQRIEHWYHTIEVAPGLFTPGTNDSYAALEALELPHDCTGLRVLDLGARDGFYSFLLERRGAKEVVAIDHMPPEKMGFAVLKDIFDSKVKFHTDNIYNVSAERYGQFDIVLCLGLLYHLRNPLLALDKLREVCKDDLYVESFVLDNDSTGKNKIRNGLSSLIKKSTKRDDSSKLSAELLRMPFMQFYPKNEINNDYTNWWGFTSVCLKQMIESTNFNVLFTKVGMNRATLKCKVNNDPQSLYFRTIESGIVT